jgi:hypothetical protein
MRGRGIYQPHQGSWRTISSLRRLLCWQRRLAAQVAKLLNGTPEDVAVLVSAGKLRPLGRPNTNAVKFFSALELMTLLADREWLDEATKTNGQFWKRKNARRNGLVS